MAKLTLAEIRAARWAEGQSNSAMSLETYLTYLIYLNSPDIEDFASLLSATEEILNTLNKTNSQVSILEFDCSIPDGQEVATSAFTKYKAWIDGNDYLDYHVINEIYYPNPKDGDLSGTPIIMIRYTGAKVSGDQ